MRSFFSTSTFSTSTPIAIVLLLSLQFVIACSGSSNSQSEPGANATNSGMSTSDDMSANANNGNDANPVDDDAVDTTTNEVSDITPGSETGSNTPATQPNEANGTGANTSGVNTTDSNPGVPDPMTQNSTRVNFEIQVPAYQSNDLQVILVWGEKTIKAAWVGDEIWNAVDDFPTDTEQLLIATFYDANGDITLASFETLFKTGTNESMSYQITADQFDTKRWDSDADGVSNLDELIAQSASADAARVLLFTETRGYRHESIENAVTALKELSASVGILTDTADDSSGVFNAANLDNYDAVVWVLTSGDVLSVDEQTVFENYIRSGGGYAGIHAASDTEYDWPWYGGLVGAYFERHPQIQTATQNVEDGSHASTAHLNLTWTRTDEWYDYSINPRAQVNVLLSLDEASYDGGGMGDDHPSAWYHNYDGGRSWYTGGGHTSESYDEPDFRTHLLGGLRYAAGQDGL